MNKILVNEVYYHTNAKHLSEYKLVQEVIGNDLKQYRFTVTDVNTRIKIVDKLDTSLERLYLFVMKMLHALKPYHRKITIH